MSGRGPVRQAMHGLAWTGPAGRGPVRQARYGFSRGNGVAESMCGFLMKGRKNGSKKGKR